MADHADDDFDGDIFIYRGGRAPQHITHALIDKSLDEIEDNAFKYCKNLLTVDTHDGIRKIGRNAFSNCYSLPQINLKSVVEIDDSAFERCESLESVEFGDKLERIGVEAFNGCSLKHLKLPSIITIANFAFPNCTCLTDVELSERLGTIGNISFASCGRLQRIAIPLKRDLFPRSDDYLIPYNQFQYCDQLKTVDIIGGIHKTFASLHMESWRTEMTAEINHINQVLPNTSGIEKTDAIRQWMESLLDKLDHYKAEHYRYVKEGITLLELALWKAKLSEKRERRPKRAKFDAESYRRNKRVTCGVDIVIKNVLPFLQLE